MAWWFRRVRRRSKYLDYIDPELVRWYVENPDAVPGPSQQRIEFVWVRVRDDSMDAMLGAIEQAAGLLVGGRAFIEVIAGPVLLATFGLIGPERSPAELVHDREALVGLLRREMGDGVAILHGSRIARVGIYGSRGFSFGALFCGYADLLRQLTALPLGAVVESELLEGQTGNQS